MFKSPDRRNLVGRSSVICLLTETTFPFQRDPSTGLYVHINTTDSNDGKRYLQDQQINDTSSDTFSNQQLNLRLCWCSNYFQNDRPLELCSSEFDTCSVPFGRDDQISCYSTSGADTFIISFWPVVFVWVLALAYCCLCTESGRDARRYAARRYHNAFGNLNDDTDERDLEALLQDEPEKAVLLYQRYVHRQCQRLQHPEQKSCFRLWIRWKRYIDNANDDDLFSFPQQRLELKTKVFCSTEHDDAEAPGIKPKKSDDSTPSKNDPETAVQNHGWKLRHILSPFMRNFNTARRAAELEPEPVTLEEMDDELEHGVRCAICLMRLHNGDIVGDLPCPHMLHKVRCSSLKHNDDLLLHSCHADVFSPDANVAVFKELSQRLVKAQEQVSTLPAA